MLFSLVLGLFAQLREFGEDHVSGLVIASEEIIR